MRSEGFENRALQVAWGALRTIYGCWRRNCASSERSESNSLGSGLSNVAKQSYNIVKRQGCLPASPSERYISSLHNGILL